MKIMQNDAC